MAECSECRSPCSSNWTLGIWPLFLRAHNKSESMRLRLHVNYRQLFQGRRGWAGGSLSVYRTRMNGTNLAKKLYPDIFLLSPRETGEEAWSRVTEKSKKNPPKKKPTTHSIHTVSSRRDLITHQVMSVFYFFVTLLAPSCSGENRAAPLFYETELRIFYF